MKTSQGCFLFLGITPHPSLVLKRPSDSEELKPPKPLTKEGKENNNLVNLLLKDWNQKRKKPNTEEKLSTPETPSPHYGLSPKKLPLATKKQELALGPGGTQSNKRKETITTKVKIKEEIDEEQTSSVKEEIAEDSARPQPWN